MFFRFNGLFYDYYAIASGNDAPADEKDFRTNDR